MASGPHADWTVRDLVLHGLVQGVGFRGQVCRGAAEFGVCGWVRNEGEGLRIHAEGPPHAVAAFLRQCRTSPPSTAHIATWSDEPAASESCVTFAIHPSISATVPHVRVPPDMAMCPACQHEVSAILNRRHAYPLTTCTQCGPRFSIVAALPFDRANTSMSTFALCDPCTAEYSSSDDRRFHAQTIACAVCGPSLQFGDSESAIPVTGATAIESAAARLRAGGVVAVKGIGGYQLLARADKVETLQSLRRGKARPQKPFAVMVMDVATAACLGEVNAREQAALTSAANPIVVLRRRQTDFIAEEVAPGLSTIGVFLPTSPLHFLLLRHVGVPVVVTSGNQGDEPLIIDDAQARERLTGIAEAFLTHNRHILQRVDDSVVRIMADGLVVERLARGIAPLPLPALESRHGEPPGLAVGGHQKVALAAWTGTQAILGPHIGDMHGSAARLALAQDVRNLTRLYGFQPRFLAHDEHPDYYTTRWARNKDLPLIPVQHHHAHAAAVMAEHGRLGEVMLALTWDGSGWGSDGSVWGGEILRTTASAFTRVGSLRPFRLIGGEAAIREPVRIALALLAETLGPEAVTADERIRTLLDLARAEAEQLLAVAASPRFSPTTSSVGRLFDAIAAMVLGLHRVTYEGEAAIHLECIANDDDVSGYSMPAIKEAGLWQGDWRPLIKEVCRDLQRGTPAAIMATRFHQSLADWSATVAREFPGLPVVLAGGCFQNRQLRRRVWQAMRPPAPNRVGRFTGSAW